MEAEAVDNPNHQALVVAGGGGDGAAEQQQQEPDIAYPPPAPAQHHPHPLLPCERELLEEMLEEDALCIAAPGLGWHKVAAAMLRLHGAAGNGVLHDLGDDEDDDDELTMVSTKYAQD